MTQADIVSQVNQLMITGFELQADMLKPGARLVEDLGLDSLDAVDMLVYIEENMGVKVEGERLASVKTLDDVYQLAKDSWTRSKNSEAAQLEASQ